MSWKKYRRQRILIRLFPRLLSKGSGESFSFSPQELPFSFLLFSCFIFMYNPLGYDRAAFWSLRTYYSLAQSALLLTFSRSLAAVSLRPSGFPC